MIFFYIKKEKLIIINFLLSLFRDDVTCLGGVHNT